MSNTTHISQENIVVGEVANGLPLTIPVYRLKGDGTGPSVYIQANMHGAEVQGNAVIFQLLEQLKHLNLNSDITLVPYANPIGCNQNLVTQFAKNHTQYDDATLKSNFKQALIDEVNSKLNGPAYLLNTGKRIALNLQKLAHQADIVLDLHTGPISSKHLYCPTYATDSARYFNIEHVLLIPSDFDGAMDEANFCPWWHLSDALSEQGRELTIPVEAFTVELGSQEKIDLKEALNDANSILSYLNHKGVLQNATNTPADITRYACNLDDYFAYYAPIGGMVEYIAPLGGHIKAGEPIANILRMERYLSEQPLQTLTLDCDAIAILHFASASVNQGTELYKFFTNIFEL